MIYCCANIQQQLLLPKTQSAVATKASLAAATLEPPTPVATTKLVIADATEPGSSAAAAKAHLTAASHHQTRHLQALSTQTDIRCQLYNYQALKVYLHMVYIVAFTIHITLPGVRRPL